MRFSSPTARTASRPLSDSPTTSNPGSATAMPVSGSYQCTIVGNQDAQHVFPCHRPVLILLMHATQSDKFMRQRQTAWRPGSD